jgi:bidirectional [NiFe] hydrogenase diaphorase subunit
MPPAALKPSADATPHPSGDNRFKILEATMKRQQYQPDALLSVMIP